MIDYVQVVTATSSEEEAQKIARTLVQQRLAASAQILGPMTSMYWWKGKIETSREWQCTAKTRKDLYDQVAQTIQQLHSYEVPSILAVPILAGSASYLEWLDREVVG